MAKKKDPAELEAKLKMTRAEVRQLRSQLESVHELDDFEMDEDFATTLSPMAETALGVGVAVGVGMARAHSPEATSVALPVLSGVMLGVGFAGDNAAMSAVGRAGIILAAADFAENTFGDYLDKRAAAEDREVSRDRPRELDQDRPREREREYEERRTAAR